MALTFMVGQSEVVMQSLKAANLKFSKGEGCLKSNLVNQQVWFLQLVAHDVEQKVTSEVEEVTVVVDNFADIFAEPIGLPPQRSFDHQVPLKDNIGPYRYPHCQKTEIENIVKD